MRTTCFAVFATLTLLTACGSPTSPAVTATVEDLGHVHDVVVDDGTVYLASHTGVFRVDGPHRATLIGSYRHDFMSMDSADGRLVGSGHPDLRFDAWRVAGKPPHLGFVTSDDRGESWSSIALLGDVDFHSLSPRADGGYFGADSQGAILASIDDATWETRSDLYATDLAASPASNDDVLAIDGETGLLLVSGDGARTWAAIARAPVLERVQWRSAGVAAIAVDGSLYTAEGARWRLGTNRGDRWPPGRVHNPRRRVVDCDRGSGRRSYDRRVGVRHGLRGAPAFDAMSTSRDSGPAAAPPVLQRPDRRTLLIALLASMAIVGVSIVAGVFLIGGESEKGLSEATALFDPPYPPSPITSGLVQEIALTAAPTVSEVIAGTATDVWSFNGSVPGPELRLRRGDGVRITVRNDLAVPTSVHWHGIRVPNAMDGVPGINQAVIAPGDSFVYEFTPPDAGTFWYHSHLRGNEQIDRGLYGAIVVEDADPAPYSQDVVWMLDDWLLGPDWQLDPDFDSSDDIQHNGRYGDTLAVNGRDDLALNAAPGQRIRLRLVNASNARIYRLQFDRVPAFAIAVDGLYVESPFDANNFELAPGSRLDVDIQIPPDATGAYLVSDSFTSRQPIPLASIDVAGPGVSPPQFAMPSGAVPDWSSAADAEPSATFVLSVIGEETGPTTGLAGEPAGDFRWAINDRSWPNPTSYTTSAGTAEKLRFVNTSGSFHPMHLHGQFFQVVARNGSPVREGYFRDTVLVNPDETVDIVVVPLDRGTWALHCHIQTHSEYGMLMLYTVQ